MKKPKKVKVSKQQEDYMEEEDDVTSESDDEDDEDEEPEDEDDESEDDDDDDDDDEEEDDDEDDDDDSEHEIKTIFGIDRKIILIGLVVLVIIIVGTVIMKGCSNKDEEASEEYEYGDYEIPPSELPTDEQFTETAEEPAPAETHTVEEVVVSDEMAAQLQLYGYTADEIELAKQFGIEPNLLIENAKLRQTNSVKEMIKQLSNTGSISYQNLANMTYLGQEYASAPIDQTKIDPTKAKVQEAEETINCSYEKCPTYGAQLFLKCKVLNGVYVWYAVTPQRWVQLPSTGSIMLKVKYVFYGDGTYITDIEEVTDQNARVVQSDSEEQSTSFTEDTGGLVQ